MVSDSASACVMNSARRGLGKTQHHIGCFDFAALPGQGFDLQRCGVVSHDATDLETAVFFVKDIHWG